MAACSLVGFLRSSRIVLEGGDLGLLNRDFLREEGDCLLQFGYFCVFVKGC